MCLALWMLRAYPFGYGKITGYLWSSEKYDSVPLVDIRQAAALKTWRAGEWEDLDLKNIRKALRKAGYSI
jgi:hypothetical protein